MKINLSQVQVIQDNGKSKSLGDFKGQVLLIVNVASQCGFTKQYEGLQELQKIYGNKGFQVLGFPCNDFGSQEPGTIEEIKSFCSTSYKTTFKIFEKVHAKGETTEPYTTLIQSEPKGEVKWNFEKFLIDKEGYIIGRYESSIEPNSKQLKEAIEKALSQ